MSKNHKIIMVVIAIILSQLACNLGGSTTAPTSVPKINPTGESGEPVALPTSTAISLEVSTQPAVAVVPPTPALNLEIPQPKSGTGSIAGRLLWNSNPVVGTQVKLCEKMAMLRGCEGKQFTTVTDDNGIYLLADVTPGDYALVFHAIDTDSWVYVTSSIIKARKFTVESGKTVVLEDQHLMKFDLKIISPVNKARVSEAKPTLKWEPYSGATSYHIYLTPAGGLTTILRIEDYTKTEITPDQPLLACDYDWQIEAYNQQNVMIAEYNGYSRFTVIDQPNSCYVKIQSPSDKSFIASTDVKLSWEAHPLAEYYKLVVWKGKVGGETILDYARIDNQTSYTFDSSLAPDKYIWNVIAATSSGDLIAVSGLYEFSIK